MTGGTGLHSEASEMPPTSSGKGSEPGDACDHECRRLSPSHLATDPEAAADDLVKLVLAVVDTVRQLLERQAIRRVESGALSDAEIERLGVTLLRLEERMAELKLHFGLDKEDLSLRLGTAEGLMEVPRQDEPAGGVGDGER